MGFKYFGCAYYPEVWPEERWEQDVAMMKQIGFNIVRIGEFAWSRLEPRDGVYSSEWLHKIVDLLHSAGISVMLCTPSAVPPQWMVRQIPEIRLIQADGSPRNPNARRHYCVSSAEYRRRISRFLQRIGSEFATHPAVKFWQIDNEIALAETGACFCPTCRRRFLDFLRRKYRTVEALNRAWGCGFWSHDYSDWEEIELPLREQSHLLDWAEFETEQFSSFLREQRDLLKSLNSDWRITTNSWIGLEPEIAPERLFEVLDFTAYDSYINFYENLPTYRSAWSYYKNLTGKPQAFWLAESGAWNPLSAADHAEKALRAWAWELFARGCEGMMYFRWRQSLMGEENHPAILPWDGSESTAYKELGRLGREMRERNLQNLPLPVASVAMLADSKTAILERNRKSTELKERFALLHDLLNRLGVECDVLPAGPAWNLSAYRLLILPQMEFVSRETADDLKAFVRQGGKILALPRLATLDANGKYLPERSPYGMRDLFGAGISEYSRIQTELRHPFPGSRAETSSPLPPVSGELNGSRTEFSGIMGKIIPETAEIRGNYQSGLFRGSACLTKQIYGSGTAWLLGSFPEENAFLRFLKEILDDAEIQTLPKALPRECSILTRGNMRFYINASEKSQSFSRFDGSSMKLDGYDVAFEHLQRAPAQKR